jgi:four helix bundle protein
MCPGCRKERRRKWSDSILDFGFSIFDWVMTEAEFKRRTAAMAVRALKLVEALPRTIPGKTVGTQLARAATSVAANYRSACRAGSPAAFRHELTIAEEECDESAFWIEFAVDAKLIDEPRTKDLLAEVYELLAMLVASRKTSLRRQQR